MPKRNLVIITVAALMLVMFWKNEATKADRTNTYEIFGPMVDVYEEINKRYVAEVDPIKLRNGAITGMLDKLDPFSNYITAEEAAEFQKDMKGEFGGIGISVGIKNNRLTVISPLEDTPAFRAGILAGDWIKEIDGKPTFEPRPITLQEAVNKLTGKPGTKVKITVVSETDRDFKGRVIELTRAVIKIHSVKGWKRAENGDGSKWDFMMDPVNKIGYIRITQFMEDTDREFAAAMESLQEQACRGVILDLRFNPGGLLNAAVSLADRFLKKGVIVSTKGRKSPYQESTAKDDGLYSESVELAVLVNEYSASASEILAGALKDHNRAGIVGVRSFGKGSVQNVIPMEGNALLKLTTAYYYLPSGRCVHRLDDAQLWGVDPTVVVKTTPAEQAGVMRARRDADVIRKPNQPNDPAPKPDEKKPDAKKPDAKKPDEKKSGSDEDGDEFGIDPKTGEPYVDRQLNTAHTMLLGQLLVRDKAK